jgi:flagellin-like protein
MNFRKFRKATKALSPVVASIILIAVTVAVSVVVAAWMGGMTIGLMGNAEQVSVTDYSFNPAGTIVTFTVRNTGTAAITISSATIDGANCTTTSPVLGGTAASVAKGATGTFALTNPNGAFNAGAQYAIKLVTAKGTTVPYTITYTP